jgi:hypothetical protein
MKKTKESVELKDHFDVVEILVQRLESQGRKKGRPAEDFFR